MASWPTVGDFPVPMTRSSICNPEAVFSDTLTLSPEVPTAFGAAAGEPALLGAAAGEVAVWGGIATVTATLGAVVAVAAAGAAPPDPQAVRPRIPTVSSPAPPRGTQ